MFLKYSEYPPVPDAGVTGLLALSSAELTFSNKATSVNESLISFARR